MSPSTDLGKALRGHPQTRSECVGPALCIFLPFSESLNVFRAKCQRCRENCFFRRSFCRATFLSDWRRSRGRAVSSLTSIRKARRGRSPEGAALFNVFPLYETRLTFPGKSANDAGETAISAENSSGPGFRQGRVLAGRLLRKILGCLLYTSPSPRDGLLSRMPSSA